MKKQLKNLFITDNFNKHKTDFIKLYLKLLITYPKEYMKSFLNLNLPYWYLEANTIDPYSKRQYIETENYNNIYYKFERYSILPELLPYYEKVANYKIFEKTFLLKRIFSISTPIWIILFAIFALKNQKQNKEILYLIPLLLLWITYIAGPVSNFRYIYPIFSLYPLIISLIFNTKK